MRTTMGAGSLFLCPREFDDILRGVIDRTLTGLLDIEHLDVVGNGGFNLPFQVFQLGGHQIFRLGAQPGVD